jgi:hypothetical protein
MTTLDAVLSELRAMRETNEETNRLLRETNSLLCAHPAHTAAHPQTAHRQTAQSHTAHESASAALAVAKLGPIRANAEVMATVPLLVNICHWLPVCQQAGLARIAKKWERGVGIGFESFLRATGWSRFDGGVLGDPNELLINHLMVLTDLTSKVSNVPGAGTITPTKTFMIGVGPDGPWETVRREEWAKMSSSAAGNYDEPEDFTIQNLAWGVMGATDQIGVHAIALSTHGNGRERQGLLWDLESGERLNLFDDLQGSRAGTQWGGWTVRGRRFAVNTHKLKRTGVRGFDDCSFVEGSGQVNIYDVNAGGCTEMLTEVALTFGSQSLKLPSFHYSLRVSEFMQFSATGTLLATLATDSSDRHDRHGRERWLCSDHLLVWNIDDKSTHGDPRCLTFEHGIGDITWAGDHTVFVLLAKKQPKAVDASDFADSELASDFADSELMVFISAVTICEDGSLARKNDSESTVDVSGRWIGKLLANECFVVVWMKAPNNEGIHVFCARTMRKIKVILLQGIKNGTKFQLYGPNVIVTESSGRVRVFDIVENRQLATVQTLRGAEQNAGLRVYLSTLTDNGYLQIVGYDEIWDSEKDDDGLGKQGQHWFKFWSFRNTPKVEPTPKRDRRT